MTSYPAWSKPIFLRALIWEKRDLNHQKTRTPFLKIKISRKRFFQRINATIGRTLLVRLQNYQEKKLTDLPCIFCWTGNVHVWFEEYNYHLLHGWMLKYQCEQHIHSTFFQCWPDIQKQDKPGFHSTHIPTILNGYTIFFLPCLCVSTLGSGSCLSTFHCKTRIIIILIIEMSFAIVYYIQVFFKTTSFWKEKKFNADYNLLALPFLRFYLGKKIWLYISLPLVFN